MTPAEAKIPHTPAARPTPPRLWRCCRCGAETPHHWLDKTPRVGEARSLCAPCAMRYALDSEDCGGVW